MRVHGDNERLCNTARKVVVVEGEATGLEVLDPHGLEGACSDTEGGGERGEVYAGEREEEEFTVAVATEGRSKTVGFSARVLDVLLKADVGGAGGLADVD